MGSIAYALFKEEKKTNNVITFHFFVYVFIIAFSHSPIPK